MELKATTEPEQAQQAYRRADHELRRQIESDVEAFLAAGGQIQHLDADEAGQDMAAKQTPMERRSHHSFGRHQSEESHQTRRVQRAHESHRGGPWKRVHEALETKPGLTRAELARHLGWDPEVVSKRISRMAHTMRLAVQGSKRKCSVTGSLSATWYASDDQLNSR